MSETNILIDIWNYFGFSEQKEEPKPQKIIKRSASIVHSISALPIVPKEIEQKNYEQFKIEEMLAYEEKLKKLEQEGREIDELCKTIQSKDNFESDAILLKSIDELDKEFLDPILINNETYPNFSITSFTESIKELFDSEKIPTLIKTDNKDRYLNFYESILYLLPELKPNFTNYGAEIKLNQYYGMSTQKLKFLIKIGLIFGISFEIYTANTKIAVKIKDSEHELSYFYFKGSLFLVIHITDLHNKDFITIDSNALLASIAQTTI